MREINKISESLFEKIRDRFEDVSLGDENAKATQDPQKARFFNFDYVIDGNNYGNITISVIDEISLKVYFSKNISNDIEGEDKQKWYGFLRELREFARRNLLSFEPRDITRGTLTNRDIEQQSKADSTFSKDEVVSESRMYGTVNRSYESFGPVRIKIAHNKPVVDEVHGARSRNINSVFIENEQGERFKLPFTSLIGARAMARHVSAGGVPTDELGTHISDMVNEMLTLRPFVHSMRNRQFEDVTTTEMLESAFSYHSLLKDTLRKMKGKRGYTEYKENYKPSAITEEEIDVDRIREKFVKKVFPDRLAEALPIVHKAYQMMKENNNPFAQQFESWATRLSEGTWHIPETDEDVKGLAELLRKPITCGVDGMNGTNAIGKYIGDDNLYDNIEELAKVDPEADCNSLVVYWLEYNMPEVLEKIKELSPDGFVRDQGRQQEKPNDWAQAMAADESAEGEAIPGGTENLTPYMEDEYCDACDRLEKDCICEETNYPEYLGFQNDREYFKSEHEQYCMRCNHLSHIYAEHGENPDIEGEADVVCPNCGSSAYFVATDEEIEKYGPANDELPREEQVDEEYRKFDQQLSEALDKLEEGKMKELAQDLDELTDEEFKAKYNKTKEEMKDALSEDWKKWAAGAALAGTLGANALLDKQSHEYSDQLKQLKAFHQMAIEKGDTAKIKELERRIDNHKARLELGKGDIMGADGKPIKVQYEELEDIRRLSGLARA